MRQKVKLGSTNLCKYIFLVLVVGLFAIACNAAFEQEMSPVSNVSAQKDVLTIWWDKGYTLEADEALQKVVNGWQEKTGRKIELSLHTQDELPNKAQRALQAGDPPDILFTYQADISLNPRLAWEGKLADVSDVIKPVKNLYPDVVLKSVYLYNNLEKKRSYYAVPIHQSTVHIAYRRDLLKQIGLGEENIPKEWDAFWEFWKKVQDDLRQKNKSNVYGLGLPSSIGASDTYYAFEEVLEAYNVKILDSQGQLRVDDLSVRQGIVDCLKWYAKFYQQGYVPPTAVKWLNPDNNLNLLNGIVVMTPNPTLSIPASQRRDPNTYLNKLGTLEWPSKPNGQPLPYLVSIKQVIIFAKAKNQKLAKEFLTYLIQPETLGNYLKESQGRYFPVTLPIWKDSFWADATDPHISTVARTLMNRPSRLLYSAQNPAYSRVLEENVWGRAIRQIATGISPEQAGDEAIARLKQIFAEWR